MKKASNSLKKIKYIVIAILLVVIIGIIIILNNSGVINRLGDTIRRNIFALDEENIETISYYTVGAVNGDYLTCQIAFENELGIEKITADGVEIDAKGKKQVGVDRILQEGEELQFNVKIVGKDTEEIHKILATTKNAITVTNIDTLGDGTTKTVELEYPDVDTEAIIKQYSLDDGATWQEYTAPLEVLETDNKTITSRIIYKENHTIQKADERFPLVVSESLLSATENAIMKDDTYYRIAIKDEEYTVHTYVEDESLTLESNTTYGSARDVATASEYAKSMVILKVNGDLTINSNVTLTAYGTAYGGPKGMLIYATGTLTNNGTISMTARGAKAVGQNVYLWKNQDISNAEYEYVPAVGASGGASVYNSNGKNGTAGNNRQTGGGGSGSSENEDAYIPWSGAGARGTSYSGGTGGGGLVGWPGRNKPINGQANGGAGGWGRVGGAGNPTGNSAASTVNGTGGLLTIRGNIVNNYGNIQANGVGILLRGGRLWRR